MARFKLTLEYEGTRYRGFQAQKNARTVQGELQRAVQEASGRSDFELKGAGRTDAGVHALGQVAHLDLNTRSRPEALRFALNDQLPADIHVRRVEPVPRRFHARHDAVARRYLYQVARRRSAFAKPFVWWVKDPLDVARMRASAAHFVGRHDFRAFAQATAEPVSTVVQLDALELAEAGELILLRVDGSHFLWKMVRRLVGVLVEVGRGGLPPAAVPALLRGDGREVARLTAPPSGLFLEAVFYPGEPRDRPLAPVLPLDRE